MKFTVNREKLLEPLQLACGVVERRYTSPILANLLLRVNDNQLVITGSDQEVELTVSISDVAVDSPGDITVPARKLLDICKSLPDGADLAAKLEDNRVAVDSGRFSSHLAALPAQDFPNIDAGKSALSLSLPVADVTRLLQRTSFAMAQQDVRYFFNGVLLEVDGSVVRMVATNGQRLAISHVTVAEDLGSHQYIIPRKAVAELPKILGANSEQPVELNFTGNHLQVDRDGIRMISKLIDATYPDYSRAIPEGGDKVVIADRSELREALTRTAILSNELYRNVRLVVQKGRMDMHANNPQQEEAEETVSVDYDGGKLEIGFNVSYLIEALSVMQGEKVRMTFTDASKACSLEGPDEPESLFVISPMVL